MIFNRDIFFKEYREQFGKISLARTVNGIDDLLDDLQSDPLLKNDLNAMAYILATVYHETNTAMIPTAEYLQKRLDTPSRRAVRALQDRYYHTGFYGRGYVQLTWKKNYLTMSRLLKQYKPDLYGKMLDGFLVLNPDLLLTQQISYDVLVIGMLEGAFSSTGKGLKYYTDSQDFIGARQTVNIQDKDKMIATYAVKFLKILKNSQVR